MIVDLHSHYFPMRAGTTSGAPVELATGPAGSNGRQVRLRVGGQDMLLPAELCDAGAQAAAAGAQGLDCRVLLPPPFTVLYELEGARGRAWARLLNEELAEDAAAHPDRLVGFATVALQAGGEAAAEDLEHAVGALGLRGVEILTSVCGKGLDDTALEQFWAAAEQLHVPVVVHPHYVAGAERLGSYHLRNLVGNPAETAVAGARLLFSGLLERHPGLVVVLCHGGGALPHLIGRLHHAYRTRPEFQDRAADPERGLRRLYYDTVVFDPLVLRHLVELVGADRLVVGSDFPFDMAETHPVDFVRQAGLANEQTAAVLGAGARLLPT